MWILVIVRMVSRVIRRVIDGLWGLEDRKSVFILFFWEVILDLIFGE